MLVKGHKAGGNLCTVISQSCHPTTHYLHPLILQARPKDLMWSKTSRISQASRVYSVYANRISIWLLNNKIYEGQTNFHHVTSVMVFSSGGDSVKICGFLDCSADFSRYGRHVYRCNINRHSVSTTRAALKHTFDTSHVPLAFTVFMRSYFFKDVSWVVVGEMADAKWNNGKVVHLDSSKSNFEPLFITMSMPPNSWIVFSTAFWTDSSLLMSHSIGSPLPPALLISSAAVKIVPGNLGCGVTGAIY